MDIEVTNITQIEYDILLVERTLFLCAQIHFWTGVIDRVPLKDDTTINLPTTLLANFPILDPAKDNSGTF